MASGHLNSDPCRKCQDYHGDMCRLYLFADTPVFTNASDETLESTINSHVGAVQQYTADHRRHMDSPAYRAAGIAEEQLDKCLQFLTAISCNLVYPYCEVGSTSPRPICKHSCDELREGGACGFFFDTTLLPEDAHQLRELKNKLLANCDSRVNPAGTRPECIYVSYQSPPIGELHTHTRIHTHKHTHASTHTHTQMVEGTRSPSRHV